MNDGLLLTFYGDDFTGSTDVLEALARAGLRAALFLDPPDPERLAGRYAGLHAAGVAGVGRSMTPAQMDEHLPPIFERLGTLGAPLVHYKVCSTFDSSPEVGSIGRAIDLAQGVFHSPFVPLVVGAPILRRYCLFGNLFATVGEATYRLDRHPTMSRHPVTPMDEADLRVHLGRQTARPIGLMDVRHLAGPPGEVDRRFAAVRASGAEILLFDVFDEPRLAEAGRLIWSHTGPDRPLFAVGSSGLDYALTAHWRASGVLPEPAPFGPAGAVEALAVVSGSCSPDTRAQIDWALEHGFSVVLIDAEALADPDRVDAECTAAVGEAQGALVSGRSVILATALGPEDPRIARALGRWGDRGMAPGEVRERIGAGLGRCLGDLLGATRLRRVVVAGGDTSGRVVRRLGVEALEVVRPTAPGSPLCRATSGRPAVDGLELVLKGGQVGRADFFGAVLRGDFTS